MELEEVLGNAKEREITREEALYLFRETTTYDKTLRLFQVASEVRDSEVGRIIKIIGISGNDLSERIAYLGGCGTTGDRSDKMTTAGKGPVCLHHTAVIHRRE